MSQVPSAHSHFIKPAPAHANIRKSRFACKRWSNVWTGRVWLTDKTRGHDLQGFGHEPASVLVVQMHAWKYTEGCPGQQSKGDRRSDYSSHTEGAGPLPFIHGWWGLACVFICKMVNNLSKQQGQIIFFCWDEPDDVMCVWNSSFTSICLQSFNPVVIERNIAESSFKLVS